MKPRTCETCKRLVPVIVFGILGALLTTSAIGVHEAMRKASVQGARPIRTVDLIFLTEDDTDVYGETIYTIYITPVGADGYAISAADPWAQEKIDGMESCYIADDHQINVEGR